MLLHGGCQTRHGTNSYHSLARDRLSAVLLTGLCHSGTTRPSVHIWLVVTTRCAVRSQNMSEKAFGRLFLMCHTARKNCTIQLWCLIASLALRPFPIWQHGLDDRQHSHWPERPSVRWLAKRYITRRCRWFRSMPGVSPRVCLGRDARDVRRPDRFARPASAGRYGCRGRGSSKRVISSFSTSLARYGNGLREALPGRDRWSSLTIRVPVRVRPSRPLRLWAGRTSRCQLAILPHEFSRYSLPLSRRSSCSQIAQPPAWLISCRIVTHC
jgi:hypothetical protein